MTPPWMMDHSFLYYAVHAVQVQDVAVDGVYNNFVNTFQLRKNDATLSFSFSIF
jgi:hypothetical protein